jgi:DNA polymerase-3 subunit epsilon
VSFLQRLLGGAPRLDAELATRLAGWQSLPEPLLDTPLELARFLVIDVETTGLDPQRDELLSVGLVPAGLPGIELDGLSELLLYRESAHLDRDNLVVHGITPTESATGADAQQALMQVLERIGKGWLVAFHADFDRIVLARALRRHLGMRLRNPFLDLAWLLPALYTQSNRQLRSLDDWLGHFGIEAPARHQASADALVTAELLLIALMEARRQKHLDVRALGKLASAQARLDNMMQ